MPRNNDSETNLSSASHEPAHPQPSFDYVGDAKLAQLLADLFGVIKSEDERMAQHWLAAIEGLDGPPEQRWQAAAGSLMDLVTKKMKAALESYKDLVERLPLNLQFKKELHLCVINIREAERTLLHIFLGQVEISDGRARDLVSRYVAQVEQHRKGPRTKEERVQRRHKEMANAMDAGIEVGDVQKSPLREFMITAHPNLMYKSQKKGARGGYISFPQMMRMFNDSKNPKNSKKPAA